MFARIFRDISSFFVGVRVCLIFRDFKWRFMVVRVVRVFFLVVLNVVREFF